MASGGGKGGGCGMLILGILVIGAVLWGIAYGLQILGFIVFFGGPVLGFFVAAYGWRQVRRGRQVEESTEQLKRIAADSYQDLVKLYVDLDYLELTKNIGTGYPDAGRDEVAELREEVESTQALLGAAQTPENIKDAIIEAERLRLCVRKRRQQS